MIIFLGNYFFGSMNLRFYRHNKRTPTPFIGFSSSMYSYSVININVGGISNLLCLSKNNYFFFFSNYTKYTTV